MTPAQQVALDAMRSAWPEEVVQRMLAAASGRVWVVERHYDYEGETLLAVRATEAEARAFAAAEHLRMNGSSLDEAGDLDFVPSNANNLHFTAYSGSSELWLTSMELG